MLKKYYHAMLQSLPPNALTTLGKLSYLGLGLGDWLYSYFLSLSPSKELNKAILDFLIYHVQSDYHLLCFSFYVKALTGDIHVTKSIIDG